MRDLTQGNIKKNIFDLALPTLGGMLAFTLFNLTDTYFVGKLGTESLAAMGFTFPVVMIAGAVGMGVSTGAASVLSRAAGLKDKKSMKRTATDGIILSVLIVMFFSIVGLLTMDIIFPLLGATEETLPLVKEYMSIWYGFVFVVLMPPISDASMRAVGDTFRPFIVMMVCALLNIILDPILIFGWFGLPAMGIKGAAIATVISRFCGMIVTLSFLHFHHRLVDFKRPTFKVLMSSWKKILIVGIPAIGVALFPQLLRSILTAKAAAVGGTVAVAAIATGSRIESFVYIITQSIGISIVPMIGQNWGAKAYDRVTAIRVLLNKYAVYIGMISSVCILIISEPLISLFTKDPEVVRYTLIYIRLLVMGSFGMNLYNWTGQSLNAIGKSIWTLALNGGGTVLVMIPTLVIGAYAFGFTGMIIGLSLGQVIVGLISVGVGKRFLSDHDEHVELKRVS